MNNKILVTGGSSTIGKHLHCYLPNGVYINSYDYNLTNQSDVERMYLKIKPDVVIHLAAKVGGIQDNISNPIEFLEDNILMNTLVTQGAYKHNVNKFIGILSTCIYPDKLSDDKYPLSEDMLHNGPPTPTNFGYGYAKRVLGSQIDIYRNKYNKKYSYITPCNLYSEYDDFFNEKKSHFITALLKKIRTAVSNNENSITLFGTGKPLRQFIYANDVARVIYACVANDVYESFNVANSDVMSIKQLAEETLSALNLDLKIKFDKSMPDGQYRKDVSNEKLLSIFPKFKFSSFHESIRNIYNTSLK